MSSRTYLIETASILLILPIISLSEVSFLNLKTLSLNNLPHEIIVFSKTPMRIELAQNLDRLGKKNYFSR
ncbi:MAG: hypothetical protein ACP8RL_06390 [cyanobacterium endosymbiont of Rhopalodia inflata]